MPITWTFLQAETLRSAWEPRGRAWRSLGLAALIVSVGVGVPAGATADPALGFEGEQSSSQVAQIVRDEPAMPVSANTVGFGQWTVVSVEGDAFVLVDDGRSVGWTPVEPGQSYAGNALIETGVDSQVLLFNGSDAITIHSDSRLGLRELAADSTSVEVYQDSGSADFQVQHRSSGFSVEDLFTGVSRLLGDEEQEPDRFKVYAPRLTTVVKGTVFTVTVLRDRTQVVVSDGVVEVIDPRSGIDAEIVAGEMATARPDVASGVQLDRGIGTLFDPQAKVPSMQRSTPDFLLPSDNDRSGESGYRTASVDATSTPAAGSSVGSAGATGGGSSTASTGGGGSTAGSSGGTSSAGSGGGMTTASAGVGSSSTSSGGTSAASSGGGFGGGSLTISGSSSHGSFSTTISGSGISTTMGGGSSGGSSLSITRTGSSGSSTTTYSGSGVTTTTSGSSGSGASGSGGSGAGGGS